MIADYNKRPYFVDRFEQCVREYNGALVNSAEIMGNNNYFASWLTTLFLAFYTFYGGIGVMSNTGLTLGMFLANLSIITQIGSSWGAIYDILMSIQGVFPALEKVTHLLNLPNDLGQRMRLNRERRQRTTTIRDELRKNKEITGIPLDFMPISVSNIDYSYDSRGDSSRKGFNLVGTMEIEQGQLVSLIGRSEMGKSTLLRILGGAALPEPGGFYIPAHLRVLHVSVGAYFFEGTLGANLVFGVDAGDPDGSEERVIEICKVLGLTGAVCDFVRDPQLKDVKRPWGQMLSDTQKSLCMLARAFIANPEVLCAHKPTMFFDEDTGRKVMKVMRGYVDNKGVAQDASTKYRRRPRTSIMTCERLLAVELSDKVFVISREKGLKTVDKHEITHDML
eukprot:gnl/TRDRNA2_/TRDRNA2_99378_c4_seq1.p1 gnl/TRDRNA2_/TRDRNA2_99378_c4~~gnl/TRDRNA2_/TRDRNA2_99378_c4_seq1.p1  ORF type:complete len:393 (+),score=47.37 gnl/TRDRNA2_/TRDRNA2_99378_c4_seq1:2-1180(+)